MKPKKSLLSIAHISFLSLFLILSCEKDNDFTEIKTDISGNENVTEKIVFLSDDIELSFNNYTELLIYMKDDYRYNEIKEKVDGLLCEKEKIKSLGLINKNEDSEEVHNYLSSFKKNSIEFKTSAGNVLFYDENLQGHAIWAPVPMPLMKKENRNKVSSVNAIAPIVICTSTYFRGTQYFIWGTKNSLPYYVDNNTESYY
ncbi:MAG: hypothetical protein JXA77_08140 [Bacteroidales bacterium]|nr:hypothetical protein [Bacteroidales bacterium]MBN2818601.1 hypothetical protein [Bacteroidales bacterium]